LPYAYAVVETALGWCAVATRGAGLWRSCLPLGDADQALASLQLPQTAARHADNSLLDRAAEHLIRLFQGERTCHELGLDLADETCFARGVLCQCSDIAWGEVVTYGRLAARVGKPGAARAVGQVMSRNPLAPFVPCHRVVGAGGDLAGFGAGLRLKTQMLKLESLKVLRAPNGKLAVVV